MGISLRKHWQDVVHSHIYINTGSVPCEFQKENEILITLKRFHNVCGDPKKKVHIQKKKKLRAERQQQLCLDESFPLWSPRIQFVRFSFILKRCFCKTVTCSYFRGQPLPSNLALSSSLKLHIYFLHDVF